jgi:acetyltransferase-like isoleucine patch superfamily enzyme
MYKIVRILLIPIGLFTKLFDIANEGARDWQNKFRFKGAIIDKGCSFTTDSTIGHHSHILSGAIINHSHIGNYSYCSRNLLIQNTTIGNYCSIANDVIIGLGTHPLDLFSTSPLFYKRINPLKLELVKENLDIEEYKPIRIEHDVWIGTRAIIMDGVQIATGAVVAANSVVTKNVPPYAIVGGIPAKIIKYRFSEFQRENLLKSNWWENNAVEVYNRKEEFEEMLRSLLQK